MAMTTTPTACEMCSLATTRSVWAPAMVLTEDHPTQAMLKEVKARFFVSEVYSQSFRGHKVSPVEESNDLGSMPSPRISRAGHLSKTERRSEGSHVGGQDGSEGVGEENDQHGVTWKGVRKQSQVQALDRKPSGNVSLTKSKRKELGSKVSDTERRENAVGSEPDEETSGGLVIGPQVLRNSLCRNDRGNCQQTAHRPAEFSEVGKRAHRYLESPFRPW